MNTKIAAISVAMIVVVAGVAVFLVTSPGDESEPVDVQASLSIYGNVNGDYVIDNDDVELIGSIIDGQEDVDKYPLADANNDGAVDRDDEDFIKSMISKENDYLYVLDDEDKTVKVNYPLRKTVLAGTNVLTTAMLVGATDYILGFPSSSYPVIHKPLFDEDKMLGGTILDMNTDAAMDNFMKLDQECGGLDAVIALPGKSYLKTSAEFISGAGIPIIRLDPRYGWDSIDGALTMGYMYGEETEKISQKFAELTFKYLEDIEDKVSKITDKKTYLSVAAGSNIGQLDSVYNKVCDYAGGTPIANIPGDSAEKIEIGSEGYKNYDPDFIISFRTLDYSIDHVHAINGSVTTPADEWKSYQSYWEDMDCYKDLHYVNLAMPVIAQIAYVAEILYPEEFGEGYGDKVHQEFVDNFMKYLGEDFDVSTDMTTTFGYEDIYG
ncbi:MAG: hypothetical protein IJ469_05070 [Candidatus Methanomethylophilaceae archaeon]|nr:hypothetical protein [Candidatus Methanomethylophilaceae archaeon]